MSRPRADRAGRRLRAGLSAGGLRRPARLRPGADRRRGRDRRLADRRRPVQRRRGGGAPLGRGAPGAQPLAAARTGAAGAVRALARLAPADVLIPVRQDDRVTTAPGTLILLRHGESEWNKANLFTGWVDVPLSEKGRVEAARGGELLAEHDVLPEIAHTSVLKRAITTAELALAACDRQWIPVKRSWRLNERHYGALQGKDKAATLAEYGEEQFTTWRDRTSVV